MTNIILKVRDAINDNLITTGRDCFTYESVISSRIFTLTEANISSSTITVYKNGILWLITPVAGSAVAWSRVGTVITVTKLAHGLITGDVITVTASSDITALPLASYTVTKLTANTFTIVGLDAGAGTGTCTYTVIANYSYSDTTGKLTITGTLTVGDALEVDYSYYQKYSDTELQGFIRSAISYLVVEKYKCFAIKPPDIIFPTPSESEEHLIAVVAAILIKGDVISYRTPELTINFERGDSKEKKIKKFVRQYQKAYGVLEYIGLGEKFPDPDDELEL